MVAAATAVADTEGIEVGIVNAVSVSLQPGNMTGTTGQVRVRRHSGLGVASFVIAIVGFVAVLILFGYAGYVEVTTEGGMDEDSAVAFVIGFCFLATAVAVLVGLVLGLIGLLQSGRKRIFAALGLGFNVIVLLVTAGIMWLGFNAD